MSTFHCILAVRFTFFAIYVQSNVEVTVKKTVNQLYNYSTVLGAAIKCKQYSEITVASGTHVKSVKITLNIHLVTFDPVAIAHSLLPKTHSTVTHCNQLDLEVARY